MTSTNFKPSFITYTPILFYFGIGIILAHTKPLYADDYYNCGNIFQLIYGNVYVDYQPWNSIIGLYIQMPAALYNPDLIYTPINIRLWMVFINSLLLAGTIKYYFIPKFGNSTALTSSFLIVLTTTFLLFSLPVRLDMLSAWAGLFAFLCATERKWLYSGLLCAFSFLISQKAIYHIVALNFSLLFIFICFPLRWKSFKNSIIFNSGAIGGILLYYLITLIISGSPSAVIERHISKTKYMASQYNVHGIVHYSINSVFYRNYAFSIIAIAGICITAFLLHREFKKRLPGKTAVALPYIIAMGIICRFVHPHPYLYFFVIILLPLWYFCAVTIHACFRYFEMQTIKRKQDILAISGIILTACTFYALPERIWPLGHELSLILTIGGCALFFAITFYIFGKMLHNDHKKLQSVLTIAITLTIIGSSQLVSIYRKITEPTAYDLPTAYQIFKPHLDKYFEMNKHNENSHNK